MGHAPTQRPHNPLLALDDNIFLIHFFSAFPP